MASELYNQQFFLAGQTARYPLFVPGAKTFFVGVSGYTAVGGTATAAGNSGETPQEPTTLATAYSQCVSGRGDTIAFLPGTHTLTTSFLSTKSHVRLVGVMERAATVTGDGVITELLGIDASYCEILGLRLTQQTACVRLIDIADGASCTGTKVKWCTLIGGAVASAFGIMNGENQAGNNGSETEIEECIIHDFTTAGIRTFGGNTIIRRCQFGVTASGTGISIGDQGAAFSRNPVYIIENRFTGLADATSDVGITVAGTEANTQMPVVYGNTFHSLATVAHTQDRHPEGWVGNQTGGLTGGATVDPTA